jgi:hypothetical protein
MGFIFLVSDKFRRDYYYSNFFVFSYGIRDITDPTWTWEFKLLDDFFWLTELDW